MRYLAASMTILAALSVMGCRGGRFGRFFAHKQPPPHEASEPASPTPVDPASPAAGSPDDLNEKASVLTINGDPITIQDVLDPIRQDLQTRAASMSPERYQRYLDDAIQHRVRLLARDKLLYQEASKGLTDQQRKTINEFADQQIRETVNSQFAGRQTRYEHALARKGMSLEDQRKRLQREWVIRRWLQLTISPQIADPTRDQLWTMFQAQKPSLTRPPRRQMQLIEISVLAQLPPDVDAPSAQQLAAARIAARQKATEARAELLAGVDFADVARRYSMGLHARSGGDWGWVTQGTVRPRWTPAVEALFQLPTCRQPSEVIETPDAFFIVQAAAIDPGEEPNFVVAQPQLVERFRNAQFNELIDQRVRKLQAGAQIRPENINRFLRTVAQAAPQPSRRPDQ